MTPGRIIRSLTPFLRLTRRTPEYGQAYRAGTKASVTWLMNRADELSFGSKADRRDAKVLNRAAAEMSREAKDIAFGGVEVEAEGPFFAALQPLAEQVQK